MYKGTQITKTRRIKGTYPPSTLQLLLSVKNKDSAHFIQISFVKHSKHPSEQSEQLV